MIEIYTVLQQQLYFAIASELDEDCGWLLVVADASVVIERPASCCVLYTPIRSFTMLSDLAYAAVLIAFWKARISRART